METPPENSGAAWGNTPSSRLHWARERAGFDTAAAFARHHAGRVNEGSYRSHENGTRPLTLRAARLYASLLNVTWQWLMFGEFPEPGTVAAAAPVVPPWLPEHHVVNILGADYVLVPVFDLRLVSGPGAWLPDDRGIPLRFAPHHLDWLRDVTSAPPDRLMALRVSGDAMEPTLAPGNYVLVDRNSRRVEDGIYALRQNTALQLKRIAVHASTCLLSVISDNPRYPREEGVLPASIEVVGRVIWVARTI